MDGRDSCIIRNFRHYCELDADELDQLHVLERDPVTLMPGGVIWEESQPVDAMCTLVEGWAYSYRVMNDGTRQVLDIYLPGDIIGMYEFAYRRRLTGVAMLTSGAICRFSRRYLVELFGSSRKLTAIFFAILASQQALLTERLVNLGRRNAREKVAHFVYEMCMRLRRTNPDLDHRFHMPLSQQLLADVLGLSAVHVSRTFSELREAGLVHRNRHCIEIPDPEVLIDVVGFTDQHLRDDLREYFPSER